MDILQRLASQADQVEVMNVQSESTIVGFEANRLKSSQVKKTAGVAVRVVKDGRLGFAASSAALDSESVVEKLASNVLESAVYGDEVPIVFPAPQPGPEVTIFDPTIVGLSVARMVEIGQEIVALILQSEPDARVSVNLERGVQHLSIRNQAGTDVSFERSPLSAVIEVRRVKGDDVLQLYYLTGTTTWEDDYLAAVRKLCGKLELAQKSARIQSGRMPVLFAPKGVPVPGWPLVLGLDGKNVYTGISPMKGKVGEKLFDAKLTIIDDPTIDGKFDSGSYDNEGVAHRRNVLVEQGVLKGFLYDLKTAAQSGVESTGNGSRDLFNPPGPAPTNLVFAAGETPVADIIAGIDEGLLVEDALGIGQGNVISGAFSNTLNLAFKIEKGEIVGRVKDVSIAGNVYDLLKDVAAVSKETEWSLHDFWVYRNFSLPYILLPDMNVIAKKES